MRPRSTTGAGVCAALRTLGAQAAENEFALAEFSFAEEARGGIGHVVPLDVFDFAAAIADEMVMAHAFCVVTRSAAFDGDFAHEASFYEVAKIVVGGGARGAWIDAIDGFEGFGSGWVAVVVEQEGHHCVTLGRATEAFFFEAALDLIGGH